MFVIRHIVGRTLQVYDPDTSNMTDAGPKEVLEYDIHPQAKILLNGVEVKLAELQPNDAVNIDDPDKEGFRSVEVLRDREVPGLGTQDFMVPRVLRLEQPEGQATATPPTVGAPRAAPKQEVPKQETNTGEWLKAHNKSGSHEDDPRPNESPDEDKEHKTTKATTPQAAAPKHGKK